MGVIAEEKYEEHAYTNVCPGQTYFVGTDGVWEASNAEGQMFGKERLVELIRGQAHKSAESISDSLRDELEVFRGPAKQEDDITFVIIKIKD